MSKVLFDEPLVVDAKLATKLGVDAAIVLQQVHYWICINQKKDINFYEDTYWTYNSIKEWNKTFPFYTERTLQRIFKKLKDNGVLRVGNFNKAKFDKTTWYTINYIKLEEIVTSEGVSASRQNGNIDKRKNVNDNDKVAKGERQSGETIATDCDNVGDNLATPIPETSTETSSKISTETSSTSKEDDVLDIKIIMDVVTFFENNFYMPKGYDLEIMDSWCKSYPIPLIIAAMKIARKQNARSLTYIERILINWENDGIATVEALQNYLEAREKRCKHGSSKSSDSTQSGASSDTNEDDVSRALRNAGRDIKFTDDEQYDF